MPTYKQWHPITPQTISYVVDYFLDKQQHIQAEHSWDAVDIHKWAVSTINRTLGVITLDADLGTEMYAVGTLYGYQQLGYEANTESDYPPKLLELVKDGAGFIDYCDKKDILTEIEEILDKDTIKGISQICDKAYLDYRKAESLEEEGIEGAWKVVDKHNRRRILSLWHPEGENMVAGQIADQLYDYPVGEKRKDYSKAINQTIVRLRRDYGEEIVPYKRKKKSKP